MAVRKVTVSAAMPATPHEVWAVAADLSRFGDWLVLHDGWRGELPETISAGATLTSVVAVKGLRNRIDWHIEEVVQDSALRISGRGVGGVHVSLALSMRPDGDGSLVGIEAQVSGRPVFGPVSVIIGRAVTGDIRRSLDHLAGLLR